MEFSKILNIILNIISLFGAIGLFLFGMKLMSEALQKVAGVKLRNFLAAMTSNKFKAVLTGFLITGIIQSSSATTVMIVSFVNAGLLSLAESIGLIMGANIGTTVTSWLIIVGSNETVLSIITLPLIGIFFPLIFSAKNIRAYWGEFIIGFAIIFIGLRYIGQFVPDISSNPEMFEFVAEYADMGMLSHLLFLAFGLIITIIIQSSTATIALTFVMVMKGFIGFDLAAAMILGENIGTTITANFAAIVANKSAKSAALAHFLFNIFGVTWAVLLLPFLLRGIDYLTIEITGKSAFDNILATQFGLALFHSTFNIVNTLLLIGFVPIIEKVCRFAFRSANEMQDRFNLKHIKTGLLSTAEISILQARKEIANYSKQTIKMFQMVKSLFTETNENNFYAIYNEIANFEKISDSTEIEIATYLTKISEDELSKSSSKTIRMMLKIVDDIESIGDTCNDIAKTIRRKRKQKIWFTQDIRDNLKVMFVLIEEAMDVMYKNLNREYKSVDMEKALAIEKKINKYKKELKQKHLNNIESQSYTYQAGVIYSDIFNLCGQLSDYLVNISETIAEPIE